VKEKHMPPFFYWNGGESLLNSFMSWVGGKKALRDVILDRFPIFYERYIEVFGGAGWVLFHKPPQNDFEVYNDFNSNLATLYRCVRERPDELREALRYVLNSREDFGILLDLFKKGAELSDIDRAAKFYQLIRYSYASGCDSYSCQPHDIWASFPLIGQAHSRLRKVIIENKDFAKLIRHYDRPVSFFYCDPPYFEAEDYAVAFPAEDHERLRDALLSVKGKWLLSYNDCPYIRELYDRDGIYLEEFTRLDNIAQRYEGGKIYRELLIANYDMGERARDLPMQMGLFDLPRQNDEESTE